MIIKVLGTGCTNCKNLERVTREYIASLDIDATIEKVVDYSYNFSYVVIHTPSLLVYAVILAAFVLFPQIVIAPVAWMR